MHKVRPPFFIGQGLEIIIRALTLSITLISLLSSCTLGNPISSEEGAGDYSAELGKGGQSEDIPTEESKVAYVRAKLLQKEGGAANLEQALALYLKASSNKALQDLSLIHAAECANLLTDEAQLRKILALLISTCRDTTLLACAHYTLGQSYLRDENQNKALEEFGAVREIAPQSQYAIGSSYYLAEASLKAGDISEAVKLYRYYLKSSPDGRFAEDILKRMQSIAGFSITESDHGLFAEHYFKAGAWQKALNEYILAADSNDWYQYGLCLSRTGQSAKAKQVWLAGILQNPNSPKVPEAGKILARKSNRDEAIAMWRQVLKSAPAYRDLALYNLANRAKAPESTTYYWEILKHHPNSDYAPESAWWIAWDKIKSGRSKEALAILSQAAKQYPKARACPRFLYWCGKLSERLGAKNQAVGYYNTCRDKFGWHYYAFRSKSRIATLNGGKDRHFSVTPHRQYTETIVEKTWQWPDPYSVVDRAELLSKYGATVATLFELKQWDECLELMPPEANLLVKAVCYSRLDRQLEAINAAGKELSGSPQNSGPWQMAYPLIYGKTVAAESSLKNVDPLLAHALIREESRYNALAVSSSNALGLMQLLPGTAFGVAKRIGAPLKHNADLHNPEMNIKLGVDYMAYVLKRANGNAMLAIASYNGGPNAVARWTKQFGLRDPDIFVESIPYTETRDYVRKVFGSYWNYEAIYDQDK